MKTYLLPAAYAFISVLFLLALRSQNKQIEYWRQAASEAAQKPCPQVNQATGGQNSPAIISSGDVVIDGSTPTTTRDPLGTVSTGTITYGTKKGKP